MFQTISTLDKRKRLGLDLSLILVFSFLVALPIYFVGIPGGADMPQHFQFAKTFDDSIANGSIYPGWADTPNDGNGSIGNRFYPPLTHYTFVLFKNISGNWFDGFFISVVLFFFLGGAGIYFWSREYFSESASVFGAITYILLPYHTNQVYGAGMYSEFTAAAIAPFCFWFVYRVSRNGKLSDIAGLGIAYGLLILSHLPLTFFCSMALFIYTIFSLKDVKVIPAIFRLGASVFVGLLLSVFYWSRMVTELNLVYHNSDTFSTGHFSYLNNFQLARFFPFDGIKTNSAADFNDTTLFISLGILITGAIIYFIKNGKKDFQLLNVLAFSGLAFFMSIPLSMFVWKYIPFIQKTQFPWRWMTLIEIGAAIFAAAAFQPLLEFIKTSKRYLAIIFIGFWIIGISFNISEILNPLLTYPKDYFNPLIERWKSIPSNACWWTVWAKESDKRVLAYSKRLPEKVVIENRNFNIEKWSAETRIFTIGQGRAGRATVATFYYPHWQATVNGQTTEISPTEDGLISLNIPAETSEVKLHFQEPRFVIATFYISGLMWFLILIFLISVSFRARKEMFAV